MESRVNKQISLNCVLFLHRVVGNVGEKGEGKTEDCFNYNNYREDERKNQQTAPLVGDEVDVHHFSTNYLCERFDDLMDMSHFAYACKMRYPLNLVLESWEYLWFY